MNTATAPVWASETSKTANRGKAGMTLMVINICGLAISCWMTCKHLNPQISQVAIKRCLDVFSFFKSEVAWRFPLAFQLFFVLIIFLTAFWLPESPRWLAMKHQDDKALGVMFALEGNNVTRANSTARQDFAEISTSIRLEQSPTVKRNTKPVFRLILGVAVQAMQQLTGINIISYYLPYVLTESVGLSGSVARLLAAVNAMTYLLSTLIGLRFVERWGRRRLMLYGAIGQCCCWLAITLLLKSASEVELLPARQRQFGSAAVLFFFLFNFFFGASWQGVSWLYPTEINSTQNRIVGMSYGVATNWLINFGVVFVTPLGIARLGPYFYTIWTVLNGFMIPALYMFFPETAGRSLEDIDSMFEAHPTIWVFTCKSMTARKPLTSSGSHGSGDDVPEPDTENHVVKSSRNASAVDLQSLGHLRHRQLGGGGGALAQLASMTPVHNETVFADGETVAHHTGRAVEETEGRADTEEDEDADVPSLQLTQGATVISKQASPLVSQTSTQALLHGCTPGVDQ